MTNDGSSLDFLQQWYAEQCNGDWEHEFGIKIETLDNPGWSLEIDLAKTIYEGRKLSKSKIAPPGAGGYGCGRMARSTIPHVTNFRSTWRLSGSRPSLRIVRSTELALIEED